MISWKIFIRKIKKPKLTARQERLLKLQAFLLRFLLLAIPLYLVIVFGIDLGQMQFEVARESNWLLGAMGFHTELYGAALVAGYEGKQPLLFAITQDCTGWKVLLFFAALVLAVPKRPWKSRVVGIALGFISLWLVNIARIAAIVWIYSSYGMDTALAAHDFLWQIGLGACALLLWAAWLRLCKR